MPALETPVWERERPIWERVVAEKMFGSSMLDNEVVYGKILFQSGLRANYTTFNVALEIVQSYSQTNTFFSKLTSQKEFDVYFFSLNTQGEESISLDDYGFILGLKGQTYVFEGEVDYKNQFIKDKSLSHTRYEDIEKSFKESKKIIAIGLALDMLHYCENACHKKDATQEAALYSLTESISHECNLHGLDKLNKNTRDAKEAHKAFFNLSAGSSTSPNPIQLLQGNYGDGSKFAKILLNNLNFVHLKAHLISSKIIK